jgi:NADH-quinone oxidoreductase subunit A
MLQSYLPILVFGALGLIVGTAFVLLNTVLGPKRPNPSKGDPYECGLPTNIASTFRFGISFYLIAMLFILFDIEVVFLYPVGVLVESLKSVFVLIEVGVFVFLLMIGLAFVWARGALDWK